jgi:hypothetical protein
MFIVACSEQGSYTDEIYQKPVIDPDPPAPSLSPEESMKSIYLPKGYKLELVASEPMIEEPVAIAFDGNGKMYVAEMRTFMQDIEGSNQDQPWSRVSVLEDLDGDGKMDKSTVFVDSLVLPRNLLPLDGQVIISETYSQNFYSYRDTDGDNVADERILVYGDTSIFRGNLEHQAANLIWNLDNNLYLSRGPFFFRWEKGQLVKDTLPDGPRGQYGLSQNETGVLYYSKAGGEVPALGFQQPAIYGQIDLDGRWDEAFEEPWPIIGTPDVNGGTVRLRSNNTLNKFTGVSGQEVFLGNRLPAYGDIFIPEPVGRLVRRAKVHTIDGKVVLSNAYDKAEFMASTDPNFRPVYAKTGPDGCLYIVDMYRGIIQEGKWVGNDSYIRSEIIRRDLGRNIGKGRIYRIVHEQMPVDKPEKLLDKTAEELMPYLGHANGWYRFTAQKLLVVRQSTEIVPQLKRILIDNEPFLKKWWSKRDFGIERLHALWTLDGLDALDRDMILLKIDDNDPRVQCSAIRLSEQFLQQGDQQVFQQLKAKAATADIQTITQLVLSIKFYTDEQRVADFLEDIRSGYPENDVLAATAVVLPDEIEALKKKFVLENRFNRHSIIRGYSIYQEVCASCHGDSALGVKDLGPPLASSPRMMAKDHTIPIRILLDGLSGPIDGHDYGVMAPMKNQSDQWIADVLTYVRENFGDETQIKPAWVEQVREQYVERDRYWTLEELVLAN